MVVGVCRIELHFDAVFSLKDKRQIVKSAIEKVKNRFNVSIAEVDSTDVHKNAVIGICCMSNAGEHADSMLSSVINFFENDARLDVCGITTELIHL
jgi:uncharacterized protein YlxP (DUF503 family)